MSDDTPPPCPDTNEAYMRQAAQDGHLIDMVRFEGDYNFYRCTCGYVGIEIDDPHFTGVAISQQDTPAIACHRCQVVMAPHWTSERISQRAEHAGWHVEDGGWVCGGCMATRVLGNIIYYACVNDGSCGFTSGGDEECCPLCGADVEAIREDVE